mgnify:CR=1 FL=1
MMFRLAYPLLLTLWGIVAGWFVWRLKRKPIGTAMALDNDTIKADERRTVVLARVHAGSHAPEDRRCKKRLQFRKPVAPERTLELLLADADRTFT